MSTRLDSLVGNLSQNPEFMVIFGVDLVGSAPLSPNSLPALDTKGACV
jgi:hypothetical protein